ncbi:MAG: hypothetical protein Q8J60_02260, partial [Thiobacillus sp.]|nr:hypothetical protein [Thiobacillus sp.]
RKSLSALDIVAVLTKAVQEQQQVVDEQKHTLEKKSRMVHEQKQALETLSATVTELKAEVNRLKRRDTVAQR